MTDGSKQNKNILSAQLEKRIKHRESLDDLALKNILQTTEPWDFNPSQPSDFHVRQDSLSAMIKDRPEMMKLADLGYIDGSGMAPRLQPTALRLNRVLANRKSFHDLKTAGIFMDAGAVVDEDSMQSGSGSSSNSITNDDSTSNSNEDKNNKIESAASARFRRKQEKMAKKLKSRSRNKERKGKHAKKSSLGWRSIDKKTNDKKMKSRSFEDNHGYQIGDKIRLKKKKVIGIIRYIGRPQFSKNEIKIGLELEKWHPKGGDGNIGNTRYFHAKYKHALFVGFNDIDVKLESAADIRGQQFEVNDRISISVIDLNRIYGHVEDEKQESTENDSKSTENDSKSTENDSKSTEAEIKTDNKLVVKGEVLFIGRTRMMHGILVGVQLDEPIEYGHDGTMGLDSYFECKDKHGVYIPVIAVHEVLSSNAADIEIVSDDIIISGAPNQEFQMDDRVIVSSNKKFGSIRYIGTFGENTIGLDGKPIPEGETMYGVELDDIINDDITTGDGIYQGIKCFETEDGRAMFVRQQSLISADYYQQQLAKKVQLDTNALQINSGGGSPEVSLVTTPISEMDIMRGDIVELKDGTQGIIAFVGSVDFAKGEIFGIETKNWTSDGHDGTKNGKRYFQCTPGRGRWTRRKKIAKVFRVPKELEIDPRSLLSATDAVGNTVALDVKISQIQEQIAAKEEAERLEMEVEVNGKQPNLSLLSISTASKTIAKIGDRVELKGNKFGTIRYHGPVKFARGGVQFGIELDTFDVQAHDGKGFFETKKGTGYGVFKTREEILRFIPMANLRTPRSVRSMIAEQIVKLSVDDRIRMESGRTGVVRYIGLLQAKSKAEDDFVDSKSDAVITDDGNIEIVGGFPDSSTMQKEISGQSSRRTSDGSGQQPLLKEYIGIELDISDSSAGDGHWNESRCFDCDPKRGLFVTRDEIVENLGSTALEYRPNKFPFTLAPQSLKIGTRVQLAIGGCGTVQWSGNPGFVDDLMFGIELDEWSPNARNGTFASMNFFDCDDGKGMLVGRESIVKVLTDSDSKIHNFLAPFQLQMPRMHDRMKLIDGQIGRVKFIGRVEFGSDDIYIGVILENVNENAGDGNVAGVQYFQCEQRGFAYFVQQKHLVCNLGSTISTPLKNFQQQKTQKKSESLLKVGNRQYFIAPEGHGLLVPLSAVMDVKSKAEYEQSKRERDVKLSAQFRIGDRVKLKHGLTGVVKYINTPDFADDELIGIELDAWSANAGDGSVKGEQLFKTSAGRGYFTRRKSVADVVKSLIKEGAYARLRGLVRVPEFNGKTVKIITYVDKKNRWKVKLLHSQQEKKYLGVRVENLNPILDWEPLKDSKRRKVPSLTEMPSIGDRVKTKKNKFGRVKFIGPVHFAKNSGSQIGLEIDQWDPNAGNGTVENTFYFKTNEGRAMFVKLQDLVENLGNPEHMEILRRKSEVRDNEEKIEVKEIAPLPILPKRVEIGDHVQLIRGRKGIVKYVGQPAWSKGYVLIGLELDSYDPSAHDGKDYFKVQKGRGYFARRDAVSRILVERQPIDANAVKKAVRKLMGETRKKLREIEVLQFKQKNNVTLHPDQVLKIGRRGDYEEKLHNLQSGDYNQYLPKGLITPSSREIRQQMNSLTRQTTADLGGAQFASKIIVHAEVNDAVKLTDGSTGIVRFKGILPFMNNSKPILGIEMDETHPSFGDGSIDNDEYFQCPPNKGYYAVPMEVVVNFGSTVPVQKKNYEAIKDPAINAKLNQMKGRSVRLNDGRTGKIKVFLGETEFSDKPHVGIEFDQWQPDTHCGVVGGNQYFLAHPGKGHLARLQSITDWDIPPELLKEAELLDQDSDKDTAADAEHPVDIGEHTEEIKVNIGDRVLTARDYTGVVKFQGNVHFNGHQLIGIELDQWNPNAHNGTIHGHAYMSCREGRGYFIRLNGVKRNLGSTRRRKPRILNAQSLSVQKNLIVGDHVQLARGKKGIIKYISDDDNKNNSNNEKMIGIELDDWSANGNDGKGKFLVDSGKGYFARRNSIVGLVLSDIIDPVEEAIEVRKKEMVRLERKIRGIEALESKQNRAGTYNILSRNELARIDRKKHYIQRLNELESQPMPSHRSRGSFDGSYRNKRRPSSIDNCSMRKIRIGDRVRLVGGKTGVVKHVGPVEFTEEDVVGLILNKWHPNAGDGTVKNRRYFKAPPGRGFFARQALICEHLGNIADVAENMDFDDGMNDSDAPSEVISAPMPKINFTVGDCVKLARGKTGIVKFIGETDFAKGEVIGLELTTWTPAGHNGTVRGKKYFTAADGRGYFTRRSAVTNVIVPLVKPLDKRRMSIMYKLQPIKIGDRVRLNDDGRSGVIKFIGYPSFADGEVIGIELDGWSVNCHDGTANREVIFETAPGRGLFARRDEISVYDPEKENLELIKKKLKLGDTVILTQNRKGHIKYIGAVAGLDDMLGIELESWNPEAGNGSMKGFRYFTAPDGRGIFVKRSSVVDVIPSENDPEMKQVIDPSEEEEKQFSMGDRVRIEGGYKGFIRYIGKDVAKGESVYGLEMDLAVPQGTDGVHNKHRYFICRKEHAIFVRGHVITQVIAEDEIVVPMVGNRVKITKGRFGVIREINELEDGSSAYIIDVSQLIATVPAPNRASITHKRQFSGSAIPKHTISMFFNNDESSDGSFDNDGKSDDDSDDNLRKVCVGESIELRSGKIGTVRYIGDVHFADGEWIGVELHDHPGKHDGAVRGIRYFTCAPKTGVFVKQIKRRRKDDPTRQHLSRRCPECSGKFVKTRNPRIAYKGVGIVCDGCSKHGNQFSSQDWYFQCGKCEQIDFCLDCMLQLPPNSSPADPSPLLNARVLKCTLKPIGTEWIFDDINAEDMIDYNDFEPVTAHRLKRASIDNREHDTESLVFRVFNHFDSNNTNRLDKDNINNLWEVANYEFDKETFVVPINLQQFEYLWKQLPQSAVKYITTYMDEHVRNQPFNETDEANSIEMLEKVRDVFEYFDQDMDGVLTYEDICRIIPIINLGYTIEDGKQFFAPPCDFIHFLGKLQFLGTEMSQQILSKLLEHIHFRITDVFSLFTSPPHEQMNEAEICHMYSYAFRKESDWRTTFRLPCNLDSFIENWSTMGVPEQHGILAETEKNLMSRLHYVFQFWDRDKNGRLSEDHCAELLDIVEEAKKVSDVFSCPCSFDKFVSGWNLLKRSLMGDILPILEAHIARMKAEHEPEIVADLPDTSANSDVETGRHEQFVDAQENVLGKSDLQTNPLSSYNTNNEPFSVIKSKKHSPVKKVANFHYEPLSHRKQTETTVNVRRASQILQGQLADRPTKTYLIDRHILLAENQEFNQKVQQLKEYVRRLPKVNHHQMQEVLLKIDDIYNDYLFMYAHMTDQISEYKQTLDQFTQDVDSRELQMKHELESKQRVLLHLQGLVEHQKQLMQIMKQEHNESVQQLRDQYEEKIERERIFKNLEANNASKERATPLSDSDFEQQIQGHKAYLKKIISALQPQLANVSNWNEMSQQLLGQVSRVHSVHKHQIKQEREKMRTDFQYEMKEKNEASGAKLEMIAEQFEKKIENQSQQILHLKSQKREMVRIVNEKMADLKFLHQKELVKERRVAKIMTINNRGFETNVDESGVVANLKRELQQMQMENARLKRDKRILEKTVIKYADTIIQHSHAQAKKQGKK